MKKAPWLAVPVALLCLWAWTGAKRSGFPAGVPPEAHPPSGDSPAPGGELRFCLRSDPTSFHPLLISDEPEEIVAYLTAGVLIRVNRLTQQFEPELAQSWKILESGCELFSTRTSTRRPVIPSAAQGEPRMYGSRVPDVWM